MFVIFSAIWCKFLQYNVKTVLVNVNSSNLPATEVLIETVATASKI